MQQKLADSDETSGELAVHIVDYEHSPTVHANYASPAGGSICFDGAMLTPGPIGCPVPVTTEGVASPSDSLDAVGDAMGDGGRDAGSDGWGGDGDSGSAASGGSMGVGGSAVAGSGAGGSGVGGSATVGTTVAAGAAGLTGTAGSASTGATGGTNHRATGSAINDAMGGCTCRAAARKSSANGRLDGLLGLGFAGLLGSRRRSRLGDASVSDAERVAVLADRVVAMLTRLIR